MTSKLSHLKPVALEAITLESGESHYCGAIFPHETLRDAVVVAAKGSQANVPSLNPDDTLPPVGFLLGWQDKPTVEILRIDPKDTKYALSRHNLAKAIQQKVLAFRRIGRESYGFALVYSARITFRQSEIIATIETPEPTECVCIEIVWQDDRRFLVSEVVRPKDGAPHLSGWHLYEREDRGTLWHEVGPVLAPMAFAEAILLGFEAPEGANG